ncbi:uncharacterized protein LOC143183513 [Calliopsis andreniformis]|uniref:uncharacterized protein LOC143183513 n=1 Tax=Calliopsis andreniformis TaxID=337506 RepID=UPI003FCDDD4C
MNSAPYDENENQKERGKIDFALNRCTYIESKRNASASVSFRTFEEDGCRLARRCISTKILIVLRSLPQRTFRPEKVHLRPSKLYEEKSMNINSSLPLSNCENSKKGMIMPSLISSNCEMDESLEESCRLQQHYCITLGVGPLWWS